MDGRRPASSQALSRKRSGHRRGEEDEEEDEAMQGSGARRRRAWWRRDDLDDELEWLGEGTQPSDMDELELVGGDLEESIEQQQRRLQQLYYSHNHDEGERQQQEQRHPLRQSTPQPQPLPGPMALLQQPETMQQPQQAQQEQPALQPHPRPQPLLGPRPPRPLLAAAAPERPPTRMFAAAVPNEGLPPPPPWAAGRMGLFAGDVLEPGGIGAGPFGQLRHHPAAFAHRSDRVAAALGLYDELVDMEDEMAMARGLVEDLEEQHRRNRARRWQLARVPLVGGGAAAAAAAATIPILELAAADAAAEATLPEFDSDSSMHGGAARADPDPLPSVDLEHSVPADAVSGVMENGDLLKCVLMQLHVVDLARAACVSRLWRRAVGDPAFWRSVNLLGRPVTARQVTRLCWKQRGVIEELRLGGSMLMAADTGLLQRLIPHLNRLTTLELRYWMLSDGAIAHLSGGLPCLRALQLREVQIVAQVPSAQSDASLSHPTLTSLDLSHCKSGRLAVTCPRLVRLSISSCQFSALAISATSLPRLETLHVASTQRLSDQGLLTAVTSLVTLRHLSLHDVPVSEELLRRAARSLEHLSELELVDCSGLSLSPPRGGLVFAQLRRLVVRRCEALTAAAAGLLVEGCAALEELVLDGCGQLTGLSASLPLLRSVSLRRCRLLASLELRCRRLEELSLGSLEPGGPGGAVLRKVLVASDSLRSIAWRRLPSLEDLTLDCPALTSLSLTDCDSLTDRIFDMLTDVQEVALAPAPAVRRPHAEAAAEPALEPQPAPQPQQRARREMLRRAAARGGLPHRSARGTSRAVRRAIRASNLVDSEDDSEPDSEPDSDDEDLGAAAELVGDADAVSLTAMAAGGSGTGGGGGGAPSGSGGMLSRALAGWGPFGLVPDRSGPNLQVRRSPQWPPPPPQPQQQLQQPVAALVPQALPGGAPMLPQPPLLPPADAAQPFLPQELQAGLPQPLPQPPEPQPYVVAHPKIGGCPRLQELRLDGCEGLRHARLRHSRLSRLSLRNCRGLLALRLSCPDLGALQVEECGELESVGLAPAGLSTLSLGACCALREADLACPSLEQLSLKGCGSLRQLALDCPRLRELDATFCGGLSDEALAAALSSRPPLGFLLLSVCCSLGQGVPAALAGLTGLRHLDLSYSCVSRLGPVLTGCTGLTALCLGSCPELENEGEELLQLLPERGNALPHLASLDVSYCPLSPRVVVPLVVGLTHLTHLALNGCSGADEGIWRSVMLLDPPASIGSTSSTSSTTTIDSCCTAREHAAARDDQGWAQAVAAPCSGTGGGRASLLEKLSLVRCSSLASLCLGLVPEYVGGGGAAEAGPGAGCGGGGDVARPGVLSAGNGGKQWLAAGGPAVRSLLGPPWRPVGCLLSGLRSLRLGLCGVQTVALSLPHLTHLDLNGCSALRCLELRCPALSELHLQACCALPADLWVPLLEALGGTHPAGAGRGLTLLDAQHAGLFGEAVAATLAAAAVMDAAAEDDADPGPGCSACPGGSSGCGSGAGVACGPEPMLTEGDAAEQPEQGLGEPGAAAEAAMAVGGPSGDDGAPAEDGQAGSSGEAGGRRAAPVLVVDEAALLAARDQPWWLLPRGATVLACGSDCTVCGRRNRRTLHGMGG